MLYKSLLAIDPSLTQTGWAFFSLRDQLPRAVGVLSPPGPILSYAKRLENLQKQVSDLLSALEITSADILICEGPAPLVHNPQSVLKVEQVRGIFESMARDRGAVVPGRLNPRTVQRELLGMRGKQLPRTEVKIWARSTAERLYADRLSMLKINGMRKKPKIVPQDVIDALLIGTLAASKIKLAHETKADLASIFAEKSERKKILANES